MRDPHVTHLYFGIGSGDDISYKNPPPITFANHIGQFQAGDGSLTVKLDLHFADEATARAAVEPFLRAWEIETDLKYNVGTLRFQFVRSTIIDRNPPAPGESQTIVVQTADMAILGEKTSLHITRSSYPDAPREFRMTADVEIAYNRWLGYRQKREPLPAMAYFVLTLLQASAGGRQQAAKAFAIDRAVLDRIGELSTNRGDPVTARKVSGSGTFQDLTGPERNWLDAAIRLVIQRLGAHASGFQLPLITMSQLPKL